MEQDLDASHWIARRDLLGFGAIGAAIGLLSWRAVRPPEPTITETVSVSEALARADAGSLTLIDIRRPDEWATTGIATPAHPLDMRRDDFAARLAEIATPGAPVALICARGVRSARMAEELRAAGFDRVIDVPEGMIGSARRPRVDRRRIARETP